MADGNLTYIRKAEHQIADIINGGGYMLRGQVEQWVDILIDESKLLGMVDVQLQEEQEVETDKTAFEGQVLHSADENTALPLDERAVATFSKSVLSTKPFKAEAVFSFRSVRNAINRGNFIPMMTKKLGVAAKRDVEKVLLRGDTSLPATTAENRMLRKMDGLLKLAVTNVYDAQGQTLNQNVLDAMAKQMPSAYYQSENLTYITGKNAAIDFRRSIANRSTPLGDQQYGSRTNVVDHFGTPVIDIPLMPESLTYNAVPGYGRVLLTALNNIKVGIQTDMEVYTVVEPRAGQFIIIIYFDFATTFGHEPAVVHAQNVSAK